MRFITPSASSWRLPKCISASRSPTSSVPGHTRFVRKYEVRNVQTVYKSFLNVEQSDVRFSRQNGEMSAWHTWYAIEKKDAVAVVVLNTSSDSVLLVSQFRHPMIRHNDPFPIECVAGTIDDEEQPEVAARRELREELGYNAKNLHWIGAYYGSPAVLSEKIDLYFAEVSEEDRISEGGGIETEGEYLEVVSIPNGQLKARILAGEFRDGKTQVGLSTCILKGWIG